jgi:hypothetical protein
VLASESVHGVDEPPKNTPTVSRLARLLVGALTRQFDGAQCAETEALDRAPHVNGRDALVVLMERPHVVRVDRVEHDAATTDGRSALLPPGGLCRGRLRNARGSTGQTRGASHTNRDSVVRRLGVGKPRKSYSCRSCMVKLRHPVGRVQISNRARCVYRGRNHKVRHLFVHENLVYSTVRF